MAEGNKGILIRCWAGCTITEICQALGVTPRELFFDELDADPRRRREAAQRRTAERLAREKIALADGAAIDACKASQYFIESRRGLNISEWSHKELDDELNVLADAYAILGGEGL